jgi:hypothetical protein
MARWVLENPKEGTIGYNDFRAAVNLPWLGIFHLVLDNMQESWRT